MPLRLRNHPAFSQGRKSRVVPGCVARYTLRPSKSVVSMTQRQEFIRGLAGLKPRHHGCVATIGAFDGVHRGHLAILQQVIEKARELNLPSLVMVFEPLPSEYFSRSSSSPRVLPPRIMRLRDKVCALFDAGIDRVLCLKFNEALRSLTAQDYIDRVLVCGLGIRHLVIGDDFRFGCDRSGDFAMLCRAGAEHGFSVCDTQTVIEAGERISSTRIRGLLKNADLPAARDLLGRAFAISGRVVYGKQLGRKLGFPTANIHLGSKAPPLSGVFAVKLRLLASQATGEALPGVANIGVRPTVNGLQKPLLEVHVFREALPVSAHMLSWDWYGQHVSVEFVQKIRNEQRFAHLDALKEQIGRDCLAAKKILHLV